MTNDSNKTRAPGWYWVKWGERYPYAIAYRDKYRWWQGETPVSEPTVVGPQIHSPESETERLSRLKKDLHTLLSEAVETTEDTERLREVIKLLSKGINMTKTQWREISYAAWEQIDLMNEIQDKAIALLGKQGKNNQTRTRPIGGIIPPSHDGGNYSSPT